MNTQNIPLMIPLSQYPESRGLCRISYLHRHADLNELHCHDYFTVFMVKSGNVHMELAGTSIQFRRGDVAIIPPFLPHKHAFPDAFSVAYSISFAADFLEYDPGKADIKNRFMFLMKNLSQSNMTARHKLKIVLDTPDQSYVISLFERFYIEFYQKRSEMFDLLHAILLNIVTHLGWKYLYQPQVQKFEEQVRSHRFAIEKSLHYISENFSRRLQLHDVLLRCGMSRTNYCTLFKHFTGKSFHAYLTELRIARAKDLLLNTSLSLENIAEQVGFVDVSTLYRNFVKDQGVSPGQFREEHQAKQAAPVGAHANP